jgi:hypothetical protein
VEDKVKVADGVPNQNGVVVKSTRIAESCVSGNHLRRETPVDLEYWQVGRSQKLDLPARETSRTRQRSLFPCGGAFLGVVTQTQPGLQSRFAVRGFREEAARRRWELRCRPTRRVTA